MVPTFADIRIDLINQATGAGFDVDVRAFAAHVGFHPARVQRQHGESGFCLLYTSDAADE